MSERRARYVGHPDGATLEIPVGNGGDRVIRHIPHGGELPSEIGGQKVPASFRDSLLEQPDNWTEVNRATGDDAKARARTVSS
jgi:hypothetical protein